MNIYCFERIFIPRLAQDTIFSRNKRIFSFCGKAISRKDTE